MYQGFEETRCIHHLSRISRATFQKWLLCSLRFFRLRLWKLSSSEMWCCVFWWIIRNV
jgi:hypothetical protein